MIIYVDGDQLVMSNELIGMIKTDKLTSNFFAHVALLVTTTYRYIYTFVKTKNSYQNVIYNVIN